MLSRTFRGKLSFHSQDKSWVRHGWGQGFGKASAWAEPPEPSSEAAFAHCTGGGFCWLLTPCAMWGDACQAESPLEGGLGAQAGILARPQRLPSRRLVPALLSPEPSGRSERRFPEKASGRGATCRLSGSVPSWGPLGILGQPGQQEAGDDFQGLGDGGLWVVWGGLTEGSSIPAA